MGPLTPEPVFHMQLREAVLPFAVLAAGSRKKALLFCIETACVLCAAPCAVRPYLTRDA